jgi:hypothetical protein
MTVAVYDNIVDHDTHKKVYDWGQSVSWYTKPKGAYKDPNQAFNSPIQEYNPQLSGNHVKRTDIPSEHAEETLTIHRHMIGWSDQSVKERNPIIYDLWTQINRTVFGGKGKLDGMKEAHGGIDGPRSNFIDQKTFYEKYDIPEDIRLFTCFLNARHYPITPGNKHRTKRSKIGSRFGQIHKDSDNSVSDKHFTVLYISNLEWRPVWDGAIEFYNDEFTGDNHWKHGYNIGWPVKIAGHKPNRAIVYSHDQLHLTRPPRANAPEMPQKIAFRVVI